MALINCPECSKEISDTVKKCPHCGYGIRTKKKMPKKTKLLLILVAVVLVIMCVGTFIILNTLSETEQQVVKCVQEVKDRLKNPDSLKIYEIQYHPQDQDLFSDNGEEASYLLVYFGAENGFGGTTSSYASFKNWEMGGFYNPDETNDSSDLDSLMNQMTGLVIQGYWNNDKNIDISVDKIMRHLE